MFKKYKNKIIAFIALAVVLLPAFSFAQNPLVPCGSGTDTCRLCHLYELAQNIINFLMWYIAPALAIFVIAWGGFLILTAGSNPSRKQAGRKAIATAIIGLLIVFGAWILINEFLLFFSKGPDTGTAQILTNPWTDIQCQ